MPRRTCACTSASAMSMRRTAAAPRRCAAFEAALAGARRLGDADAGHATCSPSSAWPTAAPTTMRARPSASRNRWPPRARSTSRSASPTRSTTSAPSPGATATTRSRCAATPRPSRCARRHALSGLVAVQAWHGDGEARFSAAQPQLGDGALRALARARPRDRRPRLRGREPDDARLLLHAARMGTADYRARRSQYAAAKVSRSPKRPSRSGT